MIIKSYAKVNLVLRVHPPVNNGLHPIWSIFQTISLYDSLTITKTSKKGISLTITGRDCPNNEHNLLVKLYRYFEPFIDFGVDINLHKVIPLGSGLGGGSSNAGYFFSYLEKEANLNLSHKQELLAFGSDIPYFLIGGTARVKGLGDEVVPLPPFEAVLLLVNPGIHCDTGVVYKTFDKQDYYSSLDIAEDNWKAYIGENVLLKPVLSAYPDMRQCYEKLSSYGYKICLSGSGATFFVICESVKDALQIQVKLLGLHPNYFVRVVNSI